MIAEFSKYYSISIKDVLSMSWKMFLYFLEYKNECIEKEIEELKKQQRQSKRR